MRDGFGKQTWPDGAKYEGKFLLLLLSVKSLVAETKLFITTPLWTWFFLTLISLFILLILFWVLSFTFFSLIWKLIYHLRMLWHLKNIVTFKKNLLIIQLIKLLFILLINFHLHSNIQNIQIPYSELTIFFKFIII